MQLQPNAHMSTAQAIANQILDMIRACDLQPGDQIPSERTLCETLAVGRSSVREALQILSTLNVVRVAPGSGAYVKDPRASDVFRTEIFGRLIGNSMAHELLEAREMIEPSAARLACLRGTDDDFLKIEASLAEHERALATGEQINAHAAEFHALVARASHNRVLVGFVDSILELLTQRGRKVSRIPNYARQELEEHREILDILRKRDDGRAYEKMRSHIIRAAVTYDMGAVHEEGGVEREFATRVIS